jgi:hypothetical protein
MRYKITDKTMGEQIHERIRLDDSQLDRLIERIRQTDSTLAEEVFRAAYDAINDGIDKSFKLGFVAASNPGLFFFESEQAIARPRQCKGAKS